MQSGHARAPGGREMQWQLLLHALHSAVLWGQPWMQLTHLLLMLLLVQQKAGRHRGSCLLGTLRLR